MKKRVFSLLLALVLTLSAAAIPASAAESFSDVTDKKTAQNVEVLRLLGVIEGNGAGQFNPSGLLTRAEFCKMVVVLMGKGSDAMRYKTVTIFPDVRATHWAAGYINLAVRQSEPKLLAGLPDGTFQPDSYITYGQAVTILMRVLGFADKDSGGIWPDGYINLAKSTGVSAGVNLTGSANITRAQAAQLFVNVLSTGKDGKGYTPAGCTKGDKEVTLVSMNGDKLRISGEKDPKTLVRPSSSSALNGLKGYLLTNSDGKVVTFVPKTSSTTGAAVSNAAVILPADKSTSGISALTDGRTDYTVYRNGVLSSVSALRKNDVVTYDAVSNTVYVCDTRVTVYYESCEPSPSAPVSIKVLGGTQFEVLPTAQQSLSKFKPGKTMTILLTSDGTVAGAVENDYSARGNAIGIVSGSKVQLLCGSTTIDLSLTGMTVDSKLDGKLVSISSSSKTSVGLYAKTGGVSGDLNVREGTLGSKKLASGVMLFDDGVLKNLSDLTDVSVPQSRISYARTNANGEIDLIALSSTSGELYGRVSVYTETTPEVKDESGNVTVPAETTTKISVDVNGTTYGPYTSGYGVRSGDFVAFKENSGKTGFSQMLTLDKLGEVSASAWIGKTAVNYGGRTYTVPSDVLCWNRDGGSWLDGGVEAALAYGGTMSLYVRDGVVRVIEVRG
ncbi:MAG: S-layer homology domain-containing protein [Oscillospiraceae bacterium]|nr:S-layer homology domain-containing protein [Oscillospiraceae bacterium]